MEGCAKDPARQGARATDGPGFARCSVTLTVAFQKIFHRFNDLAKREVFLCRLVYRSPCGISRCLIKLLKFQSFSLLAWIMYPIECQNHSAMALTSRQPCPVPRKWKAWRRPSRAPANAIAFDAHRCGTGSTVLGGFRQQSCPPESRGSRRLRAERYGAGRRRRGKWRRALVWSMEPLTSV